MDERGSDEEEISINLPRNNLTERRGFLDRLNLIQGGNVRRTLSFASQSSTSSQAQANNLISSPQRSTIMSQSPTSSAAAEVSQRFSEADATETETSAGNLATETSQSNEENEENDLEDENQSRNTFRDLRDMEVHNVQWTETTRRKSKLVVDGYR